MTKTKKLSYNHTLTACSLSYVSQAIAATFLPLLFIRFQNEFGFSLKSLTGLITITFFTEIIIDAASPLFIKSLGYRRSMILANILSAAGLAGLSFLPDAFESKYIGCVICVILYAIGGGFDEVLVSPIVEACPTNNKSGAMGVVHSAFSIGCASVVLLSTLFFNTAGIDKWRVLAILWACVPLFNAFYFCFVPIRTLEEEKGRGKFSDMLKNPLFWLLGITMVCAGASELAMSQWASAFAEAGLKVSKTTGDLLGPCAFAVLMGLSRIIYAKISAKNDITKIMSAGCVLCIASYFVAPPFGKCFYCAFGMLLLRNCRCAYVARCVFACRKAHSECFNGYVCRLCAFGGFGLYDGAYSCWLNFTKQLKQHFTRSFVFLRFPRGYAYLPCFHKKICVGG